MNCALQGTKKVSLHRACVSTLPCKIRKVYWHVVMDHRGLYRRRESIRDGHAFPTFARIL